ncbi:o-succinylbenzoate synthase [Bacillus sp. CECT 9360]|uniref:o-succinylbenzoate synthase n=1 Tax=Bacillus sp. CECT 9360 TaxID=2845821 RepID=UPI001E40E730|nr:o-succinylbenzoate synthase [Bacillus sp. CECT 9360]CAH0346782.1 o-succinylbenzoate synthase [Bacillus sp. CECT 9360]
MNIVSVSLKIISAPLKSPFETHLETVRVRESIIIKAVDRDGTVGYGEAVPFSSPWYTEETIQTCYHMLKDFIVPKLLAMDLNHPSELADIWDGIRRNAMAKSGMEQAIWDLYAKQEGVYLGKLFGGAKQKVAAGVVIATDSIETALRQIEDFQAEGYQRFKMKISPDNDVRLLAEIRRHYPEITLMADANSSYTLNDMDHIKKLDAFKLQMIEQPLRHDDIIDHSLLQRAIKTPICLDESICSLHDAYSALRLGSCRIINIKMGRVGGWTEAVRIHDLCLENDVPVWCGGMIEFGISRAHNIALSSLEGFTIPGDLSSSARYWEEDIVDPEVQVKDGHIFVPDKPGIGFEVNEKQLELKTTFRESFKR